MIRKGIRNNGEEETFIEELVATMRKQELANEVQGYSDYVVDDLKGKSFETYIKDKNEDLSSKLISEDDIKKSLLKFELEQESVVFDENVLDNSPIYTDDEYCTNGDISRIVQGINTGYTEEELDCTNTQESYKNLSGLSWIDYKE